MRTVESIEKNIRSLIALNGGTCKDYADKIGITPSALKSILGGLSTPSLKTVILIANKSGVTLDWLCTKHD